MQRFQDHKLLTWLKENLTIDEAAALPPTSPASPNEEHLNTGVPYYDLFAKIAIHEEMLNDKIRTLAYKRSMLLNKHIIVKSR